MSRLTRAGTAKPVSRDRILRHVRGQGNIYFPCSADHEQDWQPYPVDPYSAICDDYIPSSMYVVVFFTLTDRASTIPSNIRGCQSGTWSQRVTKVNGSHHGDNPPTNRDPNRDIKLCDSTSNGTDQH